MSEKSDADAPRRAVNLACCHADDATSPARLLFRCCRRWWWYPATTTSNSENTLLVGKDSGCRFHRLSRKEQPPPQLPSHQRFKKTKKEKRTRITASTCADADRRMRMRTTTRRALSGEKTQACRAGDRGWIRPIRRRFRTRGVAAAAVCPRINDPLQLVRKPRKRKVLASRHRPAE